MNINRREFILGSASMLAFPLIANQNSEFNDELNDLIEFSKTCKIVNFKDGVTKFNPRSYQIEYFKNILESNTLVCRKCRQCGATTMNLIYAHWMANRHPEKKVVVVFTKMAMAKEAKHRFNSMFPTNPSKWYENTPNVEFTTDALMYDMAKKNGWENFYTQVKLGKHPYFNSNTILICEEYEFMRYWFLAELILERKIDFMKTIWVGTPKKSYDSVFWNNMGLDGHICKMKITGNQVFPQSRIEELRNCLGDERFNQEIQV